jgi:hypothetical protein
LCNYMLEITSFIFLIYSENRVGTFLILHVFEHTAVHIVQINGLKEILKRNWIKYTTNNASTKK